MAALVGEQGSEFFMPDGLGAIPANDAPGPSFVNIIVNTVD